MKLSNAYVGSPVQRIEDLRLLRGKGRFVDDFDLPGQLHAAILRSPVGHATILSIDVEAARARPGVHAVYTAADFAPDVPRVLIRLFPMPSLEAYQQPVLAHGRVRYAGEPLAIVIAESPSIAEDALDDILVDLDPLEALSGGAEPFMDAPPAVALFDGNPTNTAVTYRLSLGSADGVFETADYTRREQFYVHRHSGIPMEPRGLLARWDEETGRLTVNGATKVPFANRRILAKLTGLPETSIEMIEGDTGGSFGVRGEFFPEDFLIPYAARALNRPVKWTEDRREHFLSTSHARDMACDVEIACSRDGMILALRGAINCDIGAYVRTTGTIAPRNVGQFISGPYRVPAIEFKVNAKLSNKSPSGTYRGPGRYETDFFRERLLDMAAGDLGIDRVEFRRRNLVTAKEMPYAFPAISPAPVLTELDSGEYAHVMDLCLEKAGWRDKQHLQGKLVDGRYHGLAVSCFIEGGAAGPSENARLVVEADGTVSVFVGSSAVGQGVETVLSQIAADALEMPIERIHVLHGSTTYVTEGFGSYHSRSTVMGGSAILLCATELRARIEQAAAEMLGVEAAQLRFADGVVTASDGRTLGLADLDRSGLSVEKTFFNSKHTYSYGTHCAHVAVDIRSGHVEVLDYVAFEDPGRIVNPLTLHGQSIGAIVQGLGGAFLEHLVYDDNGQLLTTTFADYMLPTADDFPNIHAHSVALCPSPNNPLGVKGAGEGGVIPVGGCIANAVANALQAFDIQPRSLPLSPPAVWALVRDAVKAGKGPPPSKPAA